MIFAVSRLLRCTAHISFWTLDTEIAQIIK